MNVISLSLSYYVLIYSFSLFAHSHSHIHIPISFTTLTMMSTVYTRTLYHTHISPSIFHLLSLSLSYYSYYDSSLYTLTLMHTCRILIFFLTQILSQEAFD